MCNWWPCCERPGELLIIAHNKLTWDVLGQSGHVSRMNPETGAAIWCTDLGENKRGIDVKIDSNGAIYVLYDDARLEGGTPANVGGVARLTPNGAIVWDQSLGSLASYVYDGLVTPHGNISLADDVLWVATWADTSGNYVHRLQKSDGAPQASFGFDSLAIPTTISDIYGGPTTASFRSQFGYTESTSSRPLKAHVNAIDSETAYVRAISAFAETSRRVFRVDDAGSVDWIHLSETLVYQNSFGSIVVRADGSFVQTNIGAQSDIDNVQRVIVYEGEPSGFREWTPIKPPAYLGAYQNVFPFNPPATNDFVIMDTPGAFNSGFTFFVDAIGLPGDGGIFLFRQQPINWVPYSGDPDDAYSVMGFRFATNDFGNANCNAIDIRNDVGDVFRVLQLRRAVARSNSLIFWVGRPLEGVSNPSVLELISIADRGEKIWHCEAATPASGTESAFGVDYRNLT